MAELKRSPAALSVAAPASQAQGHGTLSPGSEALLDALRPRVEYEIARLRGEGPAIDESEICGVLGALYLGRMMRTAPPALQPAIKAMFAASITLGQKWRAIVGRSP